jgi:AI-2 transport protein TqsA
MLVALDVRFAFVWGLLAFALNYIPNIGSVLAAIPPILQVLVFSGLYDALILLAAYLVINLVFGNILEPRMMGRGLGLSTLVVFLSLIFWGWLLGGRYVAFRTADHHRENWSGANGGWAKHRHIAQ